MATENIYSFTSESELDLDEMHIVTTMYQFLKSEFPAMAWKRVFGRKTPSGRIQNFAPGEKCIWIGADAPTLPSENKIFLVVDVQHKYWFVVGNPDWAVVGTRFENMPLLNDVKTEISLLMERYKRWNEVHVPNALQKKRK